MSTVTVTIVTEETQYPAGTTSQGISVGLTVPEGVAPISSHVLAAGETTVTFSNVPDGTGFVATAQLLDGNGSPLGAEMSSAPFDVVTPTVGIATPSSISVTVGQ